MTKTQSELFPTSTSSAEASPVSRSVSRVEKKERKTTDTSGRTCLKLLNRKNPLMLFARTLVASSTWHSTLCVLTWKPKVTPHNRLLFQLAVSKHPIVETESGSSEGKKMLPTPTTQEFEHKDMELTHTNRRKTKDGKNSHSLNLADTVRLWPTPLAGDAHLSSKKEVAQKRIKEGKVTLSRAVQSQMWPTPRARDYKDGSSVPPSRVKKPGTATLGQKVAMEEIKTTGSLNPDWVEWLMGYGQGYTDPDNKNKFTLDSHQGFPNEPDIARVTTENQYRKDRLKALGNSIVPQIAYHIGNAILEQEAKNES
jgi:hypothetical protein